MTERHHATCPRIILYKPPRIALGLLAGATLVQLLAPADGFRVSALPLAALSLGTLGFLIMLRAWWLFRRRKNPICPTAGTTVLITDDVYRLSRNPMYLGIVLMLAGVALYTGGPAFYAAAATFWAIINFTFCPYEETKLDSLFGEQFARYRARVRRWL